MSSKSRLYSKVPCSDEETASAALLLLSKAPPPFTLSCSSSSNEVSDASFFGDFGGIENVEEGEEVNDPSSCSSASSPDSSSVLTSRGGLQTDPLLLLASITHREVVRKVVPRFQYLNINPSRKLRSIVSYRHPPQRENKFLFREGDCANQIDDAGDHDATSSTITCSRTGSSVSSSSPLISRNSRYFFRQLMCRDISVGKRKGKLTRRKKKRLNGMNGGRGVPSARENWSAKPSSGVRRQAEAIKEFLRGKGCSSEVAIREVLGNNPDTSKALRILLKRQEVTRTGSGGRSDPFVYMVSGKFGEIDSVWQTL